MSSGYVRVRAQTASPVSTSSASTRAVGSEKPAPLPSVTYMSPLATTGVGTQRALSRIV